MQSTSSVLMTDLGFGAGLALWGFRACARGASQCCVVRRGFAQAFSEQAETTLTALLDMAQAMGNDGRRKIWLSPPGYARVSSDEVCILLALYAAQKHDEMHMNAQLTWLFGGHPAPKAIQAAIRVGDAFTGINQIIEPPGWATYTYPPPFNGLVVHEGGQFGKNRNLESSQP